MVAEKIDMAGIPLDANGDVIHVEEKQFSRIDELETANHKSIRQRLKDPVYRRKLWHTVWLAGAFFASGLTVGQEGPTLLDLQIITDTDLEESSAFFTGNAVGYLIGALVSGAIFKKVNSNIFIIISICGLGFIAIATPYCSIYIVMIVIRSLGGSCLAILNTAGNTMNMRLWGNESNVFMQLVQFCFAIGAIMSPLYSGPFLAKRNNETQAAELNRSSTSHLQYVGLNTTRSFMDGNFTSTEGLTLLPESTDVLYAFVITAVCSFVSVIPFIVLVLKTVTFSKEPKGIADEKIAQRRLPRPLFLFILATMGTFYLLYMCLMKTVAHFLMAFLVNEYHFMTKSEGAYISAIHWASLAVSRFLMIFLAKFLTAARLLYVCCTVIIVAYSGFLISASLAAINALVVFTAMGGMGMSGVFAAGFSWTEAELLIVTGRVSSCFLVLASVGNIINPVVLGYLMEEFNNMWFCYQLLGLSVLFSSTFVFLLLFNRCYVNKHYGPINSVIPEVSVDIHDQEFEKPLKTNAVDDCNVEKMET